MILELSKTTGYDKNVTNDPTYRELKKKDFDQARENVIDGIEDSISTRSHKNEILHVPFIRMEK